MSTTFWLKEIVERKLYLPSGAPVPFESVDGIYGVLKTDDAAIAAELEKAVKNRIGGVMKITEVEYQEWQNKKKGLGSSTSLPRERESLGAIPQADLQRLRQQGLAAVAGPGVDIKPSLNQTINSPARAQQQAGTQRVEPLTVPQEFKPPKLGKMPVKKASAPISVPAPTGPPPTT